MLAGSVPAPTPLGPRIAGVTVPLFSLRGPDSWGIGDIGDLPAFADLCAGVGIGLVQLLPLGEISGGDSSPYGAISAFGIDPIYVSIPLVPDLSPEAVAAAIGPDGAALLARARSSPTVDYGAARTLKRRALGAAFEAFMAGSAGGSERARGFDAFVEEHRGWLADYALYRALKEAHEGSPWTAWDAPIRRRLPEALDRARADLAVAIRHQEYLQWIAHEQWAGARAALRARGVRIMGDLPFMVGRDSADVWASASDFVAGRSVGVPPDEFNDEGQDWDLPPYDWTKMAADGFAWLRRRSRYAASLYDLFRIDHVVGFYRTYWRRSDARLDARGKLAPGRFDPEGEAAQLAHGEAVLGAIVEAAAEDGARVIGEDLGVIPPFVRTSLARLGVPGYKVLVWEKDDGVFRDPAGYPALSVACFGTHDTDPVRVWWESRSNAERDAVARLPALAKHRAELGARFTPAVHRALTELLAGAGSEIVLFLVQDVLAGAERINTPATVGPQNCSYRLPAPPAAIAADPRWAPALGMLREVLAASGRAPGRP